MEAFRLSVPSSSKHTLDQPPPPPSAPAASGAAPSSATSQDEHPGRTEQAGAGEDGGFFYIPNFITEEEERYLIDKVSRSAFSSLLANLACVTAELASIERLTTPTPLDCHGAAAEMEASAEPEVCAHSPVLFSDARTNERAWADSELAPFPPPLSGRILCRLQHWGGQLSGTTLIPEELPSFFTTYPALVRRFEELVPEAFAQSRHRAPNHCLVNEYLPGQGILPHEDGAAYFPCVATVSLGSHALLDIYEWAAEEAKADASASEPSATAASASEVAVQGSPAQDAAGKEKAKGTDAAAAAARPARAREQHPSFSILQERRSLLITTGAAYRNYLHGIAERSVDGPDELAKVVNAKLLLDKRIRSAVTQAQAAAAKEREGDADGDADGKEGDGAERKVAGLESLTRETRISLTFRDVEKVSKGLGAFLGKVKR